MIKCLAYVSEKGIKAVVVGPDSSETENKEASEGKYNPVFTSSEALFGSHRSTVPILKNKIEAVLIDEVHRVAKEGSIHLIFTLLESYQLYTTFRSACCLPQLSSWYFTPMCMKDWSSAALRKSEVMRVKFVEIRPFANKAVISSGSKNSGFENSFKNRLFYLQRIHDVMAVISRQQYAN